MKNSTIIKVRKDEMIMFPDMYENKSLLIVDYDKVSRRDFHNPIILHNEI